MWLNAEAVLADLNMCKWIHQRWVIRRPHMVLNVLHQLVLQREKIKRIRISPWISEAYILLMLVAAIHSIMMQNKLVKVCCGISFDDHLCPQLKHYFSYTQHVISEVKRTSSLQIRLSSLISVFLYPSAISSLTASFTIAAATRAVISRILFKCMENHH